MSYLGTNKLGKMYLGDTAIGKAYLGEDLVYKSGPTLVVPEFLPASGAQFTDEGNVTISADGALAIYYTTDGSTPTTSSTQYTGAITINADATIKAIAVYQEGTSGVAEASYTVVEDRIIIDTSVTTLKFTVKGPDAASSITINLDSTEQVSGNYRNIITRSMLTSVGSDKKISTWTISDYTKVKKFYGGGFLFNPVAERLKNMVLTYCQMNIYATSDNYAYRTFYQVGSGTNWGSCSLKVGGVAKGFNGMYSLKMNNGDLYIDMSELEPYDAGGFTNVSSMFGINCKTITIGPTFKVKSNATGTSSMFITNTRVSKLTVKSATPPDVSSSSVYNWLANMMGKFPSAQIKVPAGCGDTYKSASGWSSYASNISELS